MGNALKFLLFTFGSKRFIIELVGTIGLVLLVFSNTSIELNENEQVEIVETQPIVLPQPPVIEEFEDEEEEILEEIRAGEIELLALIVYAEAGNQDELGKRYVADVIMNRVNSEHFPDTVEGVVYQKNPIQFSCTVDGALTKAGYNITEDCFRIAEEEYRKQKNTEIVYFRTKKYHSSGKPAFKHGDHYFSTM